MEQDTEGALLALLQQRRQIGQNALKNHLGDARLQKLLERISKLDPEVLKLVVEILEDMERTNNKLLQRAGTYEELVACREFSKVIGMVVVKLKRAINAHKKKSEETSDESEEMLREEEQENGI